MRITVAIDGPAASGKGTIARAVAKRFGFAHLDTGLLYRAVGRRHLGGEDPVKAAQMLSDADIESSGLQSPEVAQMASRVAAIPEVRDALFDFQRAFARRDGGAVLDGRDIGTVIYPEAEVKLFISASDAVRARRRWLELRGAGSDVTEAAVLSDLRERDARDSGRAHAPLKASSDATRIDTSEMSIDEAVAAAASAVEAVMERGLDAE